ncbi:hypothetical protein [Paenarthrobacter sp. YJN-5]|jgi:hypothetical protein|uniref:hypothetical protein n=1 Tax=Paenarthrobacter sp. YJN-5 TaxID=2735316 RepID=UPI001877792A|nr:hypothetical protein [Paenarthrobacter sp. YJN-5]QOT20002.1 hypothetical protein HMI59_25485 [Paenarthrobacter sp. YJN-5]
MNQWFLPQGGILANYIAPGATVRHAFWWEDRAFGPAILAVAMPPSTVTSTGGVTTLSNGFSQSRDRLTYFADLRAESSYGASYRLLITALR